MAGEERIATTIGALLARDGGSVKTGPFGTTLKAAEYSSEGVPLISVGEIGYGSLRVHRSTPMVPREVVQRLPEYVLEAGDIVFGRKGAVDRSAMVKPEQAGWFLGSDGIRLRLPGTCDARFIAYQLQSPDTRSWLLQHASGTTMASLNQGTIERVPVVLPPIGEQRAIARFLGTLDDKIELNRRMSETLEATARALFKSWFVDLDPVRAATAGQDAAIPPRVADLSLSSIDSTRDAVLARGWEPLCLGDLLTLDRGLSYKGEFLGQSGVPLVNLGCFLGRGRFAESAMKHYAGEYRDRHVVTPGDLLIANTDLTQRREVLGSPALVPLRQGNERLLFSHHLYAARFREGREPWKLFVYFSLMQEAFRERAMGFATGTTVLALPSDAILGLQVAAPSRALVDSFDGLVRPMIERQWKAKGESASLGAVRDALLPGLISRELRLKGIDRIVEAVSA